MELEVGQGRNASCFDGHGFDDEFASLVPEAEAGFVRCRKRS